LIHDQDLRDVADLAIAGEAGRTQRLVDAARADAVLVVALGVGVVNRLAD
jgi:hypothetical protein